MCKRIITMLIFITVLLSLFLFPASAYELPHEEADLSSYYLYNIENDLVMAEYGTAKTISPSSTVKIMTACIALESDINKGELVYVTEDMLKGASGRTMGLDVGDRLMVEDLLYACIIGGYNDAACILANVVCGDTDEFVEAMNKKAASLGMTSTSYLNVTGINASGSITTVKDLAILSEYMSKNQEYVDICATKSYRMSEFATCYKTTITNRSTILSSYKGLASFNTGSGDGDCAVLYYNRNGQSFICIVMNVKNKDAEDINNYAEIYSKRLLYHALNDYSVQTVLTTKTPVGSYPIKYSVASANVDVYLKEDIKLFLSNEIDIQKDLTYSVSMDNDVLEAPLCAGQEVGYMIVSYEGNILAKTPLIIKKDIDKNDFLYILELMREYVLSRAFAITLITFLIIMTVWYLSAKNKFKKKRVKKKSK